VVMTTLRKAMSAGEGPEGVAGIRGLGERGLRGFFVVLGTEIGMEVSVIIFSLVGVGSGT
jgi:hypothetical protein